MPLIIDLDNTLYNYNIAHKKAMHCVFTYVKKIINLDEETFNSIFLNARQDLHKLLYNTGSSHNKQLQLKLVLENLEIFTLKRLIEITEVYEKNFLLAMQVYPHLSEFLENYNGEICVLTDYTLDVQLKKLMALDLVDKIDFIVCSEEIGSDKPCELMFYRALELLKAKPEEVVMIGDNIVKDYYGAKQVGLKALLFAPLGPPNLDVLTFKSFKELW